MVEGEQGRRSGCVADEVGEMEASRNRMGLKFKSKCLVLIQWEINLGGSTWSYVWRFFYSHIQQAHLGRMSSQDNLPPFCFTQSMERETVSESGIGMLCAAQQPELILLG